MNTFDSEFCRVELMEDKDAVLLTWKKFACGKDYREPTTFAWKLFEEHKVTRYIVDARHGFEDDKKDVEWGFEILLPGMAKTSCSKVCFILNEVNDIEGEMDMWTLEFMKYFTVIKANSYEEALKKLDEK